MTFEEWWDANNMDSVPDYNYTSSEVVWKAAQKNALADVLGILDHSPEVTTDKIANMLRLTLASPAMS